MADGYTPTCPQCGRALQAEDRFCRICGAAIAPSPQRVEQAITRQNAASQGLGSVDSRERRSGGYGCSAVMIGVLVVGFFVLIGVANGLDEGAGWAVVVFGLPILVLSALLLLVWPWAMGEMDRRNRAEAYRQQREEYLRELQIRDHKRRRQG